MRFREFLIEYSRAKTAEMVGNKLILALATDRSVDLPRPIHAARNNISSFRRQRYGHGGQSNHELLNDMMTPEAQATLTDQILAAIEEKDPIPNKAYTPWLARMYAKGDLSIEDINRDDLLGLYDIAKKRRMLKPEHNDINSFKTYRDFEGTMMISGDYNLDDIQNSNKQEEKGQAKKVYEDSNVTVIIPEDEAAACRYGRGTRWCTAATRGQNFFTHYNSQGPMYILIPKNPEHEGEKYQLHFPSGQYMDENDNPETLSYIFKRFPNLLEFFLAIPESNLKDQIAFADIGELQYLIDQVKDFGYRWIDAMSGSPQWANRYNSSGQIDDLKKMLDVKAEQVKKWANAIGPGGRSPSLKQLTVIMRDAAGSSSDLADEFEYIMRGRIFKGTGGTWGVSR